METNPGYVSATCGDFHAELPLCYGPRAPDLWEQLSEEEQAARWDLTSDLCVKDDRENPKHSTPFEWQW